MSIHAFSHWLKNIDDMVDFIVARILDQLGYEHDIGRRWTGDEV